MKGTFDDVSLTLYILKSLNMIGEKNYFLSFIEMIKVENNNNYKLERSFNK